MVDADYKMNWIVSIWLFETAWVVNAGLHYYHDSAIEFKQPAGTPLDSFFGYSITYDKFYHQLIISAPTADRIGKVYECNVTTTTCSNINLGTDISHITGYDHHYWLGATVKSGSNFLLACAPRVTRKFTTNNMYGNTGVFGSCYKRDQRNPSFSTVLEVRNNKDDNGKAIEWIMRTLGWSMDIADTDSIIVGGPGMYQRTGLAAFLPYIKKSSYLEMERIENKRAEFNFGYSVAAGYFLGDDRLCYAVSSTYGFGEVYFYESDDSDGIDFEYVMMLKKTIDEDMVGSMFGAVLCAAHFDMPPDSNRPGDLLVGAPTYASKTGVNLGAVYLYVQKPNDTLPQYNGILVGKEMSFFGSAIANVGDLNGDGKDEIAIGAPQEDNGIGAVYLYDGAGLACNPVVQEKAFLQKFTPRPQGYNSFGSSLSVLQDHDKNGCNELAIGAPYDGKVVVYSCFAAVTITKISAVFPKLQDRNNERNIIQFEVCIHLQYPEKPSRIIADIATSVAIIHQHAALAHPNDGNMFTFHKTIQTKKPMYCNKVELLLPSEGNYASAINYEITTKLLNDPMKLKNFDSSRVVLSHDSVFMYKGTVRASDCAGDKCVPNLSFHIRFGEISEPFIIGSKDMETFGIEIENTGEVAYDPCVQIKVYSATLYQLPRGCSTLKDHSDVCECISRKPLKTGHTWKIDDITLNLKDLTSRHSSFAVEVTLFEFCKEGAGMTKKHSIELKSDFDGIDIKGTTNNGDIINMNEETLRDGKFFEHIYTITNIGMTHFENLATEIIILKEKFISYPPDSVMIYSENNQKNDQRYCSTKAREGSDEITALCFIDRLAKGNYFKVRISMQVVPQSLEYDSLLSENKTVISDLIIKSHPFSKQQRIITTIAVYETAVELWKILAAVLVGIFLLILLILVLQLCGCLKRSKKKDLKDLKQRVHRESVRRSMRPRNSDDTARSQLAENNVTCEHPKSI